MLANSPTHIKFKQNKNGIKYSICEHLCLIQQNILFNSNSTYVCTHLIKPILKGTFYCL